MSSDGELNERARQWLAGFTSGTSRRPSRSCRLFRPTWSSRRSSGTAGAAARGVQDPVRPGESGGAEVSMATGSMVGIDELVTLANWRQAPFNRWSFQHVGQLVPTARIDRGDGPAGVASRSAQP